MVDRANVAFGSMPPVSGRGTVFAAQAETWRDVPFAWQGRVRAGADCKGVIAGCAAELGYPEAESLLALAGDYGEKTPTARLRAGLATLFDLADDRQPGDVLLVRLFGAAQHLVIAAPTPGKPWRAIEAMPVIAGRGTGLVRPAVWEPGLVDSIWRWRCLDRPPAAGPA